MARKLLILASREPIPDRLLERLSVEGVNEGDRLSISVVAGNSRNRFDTIVGDSHVMEPRNGLIDTRVTVGTRDTTAFGEATVKVEVTDHKTGATKKGTASFGFRTDEESPQCPTVLVSPGKPSGGAAVFCDFTVLTLSSKYWMSDLALAPVAKLYAGRCDCDFERVKVAKKRGV